jgi:cobyrinic acid a,c-diamide synthase
MPLLGPRIVVAGTSSGVGKTTVATGLMAALRSRDVAVAGAKVGPDFIDPGYHSLASGRPPRNLDAWLCGPEAIVPLAARAAEGAAVLVVEGVMGLFDGAADGTPSATADIAKMIAAPVVLLVDASAMSTSVAAIVHGYATYDPTVEVAGVILNRVGSAGHEVMLREALAPLGLPVLGALRRDDAMAWRDRHLGLVPVAEQPASVRAALDRLAFRITEQVDLEALLSIARRAPRLAAGPVSLPAPQGPFTAAVAAGRAFTFTYTDTLDALEAAGAEVVAFDPLADEALPAGTDGLVLGGGFPEEHAVELAANEPLLTELAAAVTGGVPTWAECGGLLLLAEELDGRRMAGVLPARAHMTDHLTLGYRQATTRMETVIGTTGTALRGHEFHYSAASAAGDAMELSSRWGRRLEGWGAPHLLATYLHHHPGGDPRALENFAGKCALRHALRDH